MHAIFRFTCSTSAVTFKRRVWPVWSQQRAMFDQYSSAHLCMRVQFAAPDVVEVLGEPLQEVTGVKIKHEHLPTTWDEGD